METTSKLLFRLSMQSGESMIFETLSSKIIFILLLLYCHKLLSMLLSYIKKNKIVNEWILLGLQAAYMPFQIIIGLSIVIIVLNLFGYNYPLQYIITHTDSVYSTTILLLSCWFLLRLRKYIEIFIRSHQDQFFSRIDPALLGMISQLLKIICACCVGGILLYLAGVPFKSLMIFQGAITIAIGIASQNVLGNGFGGLMLLINKPFKIGDLISSPDKKIEGYVQEIRWDSTKIINLDRRLLHVPNSIFTQIIILNLSNIENRHIFQSINLRYQDADKVNEITYDIQYMLQHHKEIDQKQLIRAHWIEFSPRALRIEVQAFTKTIDSVIFYKVQQDVCIKISEIIKKHDAKIAVVLSA